MYEQSDHMSQTEKEIDRGPMQMRRKCSTRSDLCLTGSSKSSIDLIPLCFPQLRRENTAPTSPRFPFVTVIDISVLVWCPRPRSRQETEETRLAVSATSEGLSDFGERVGSHHECPSL